MNEKRVIWTVVTGTALLTGWRAIRTGTDPIPQLAGIGASGVMLLFVSEFAPKLASGFAVLLGTAFALAWEPTEDINPERVTRPGMNFPRQGKGGQV